MLTKDCKHYMIEVHCNESSDGASSYRVDTMEINNRDHEYQYLWIGRDGSDYDNNEEYDYDSDNDEYYYDDEDDGNWDDNNHDDNNYDKDNEDEGDANDSNDKVQDHDHIEDVWWW